MACRQFGVKQSTPMMASQQSHPKETNFIKRYSQLALSKLQLKLLSEILPPFFRGGDELMYSDVSGGILLHMSPWQHWQKGHLIRLPSSKPSSTYGTGSIGHLNPVNWVCNGQAEFVGDKNDEDNKMSGITDIVIDAVISDLYHHSWY